MFVLSNGKDLNVTLRHLRELKIALKYAPFGEYTLFEVTTDSELVKILTISSEEMSPGGPRSNVCLVAS